MQASAAHLMLRRKAQVTYPQNAICYASRTKDQYKRRVQPARYKRPVQTVPYEPARDTDPSYFVLVPAYAHVPGTDRLYQELALRTKGAFPFRLVPGYASASADVGYAATSTDVVHATTSIEVGHAATGTDHMLWCYQASPCVSVGAQRLAPLCTGRARLCSYALPTRCPVLT
eukprot:3043559-Rhodomonas_salina.2